MVEAAAASACANWPDSEGAVKAHGGLPEVNGVTPGAGFERLPLSRQVRFPNVRPVFAPTQRLIFLLVALAACNDSQDADADAGGFEPDMRRIVTDMRVADMVVDAAPPADANVLLDQAVRGDGPVEDAQPIDASTDAGIADAAVINPLCEEPPQRPPQDPLALEARCRAARGPLRIRDLRDRRCPDYVQGPDRLPGIEVELPEAVVTAVFNDAFAVQDPEGGPWSAVWVYNRTHADMAGLQPGTRVRLVGQLMEFFTLTELVIEQDDGIEIVGQGAPPAPIVVSDPARIADGGDLVEPLESVLLEVPWVRVLMTAPDCPRDFGMFVVDGNLRIGGEAELDYEPARADVLESAVGVLHYSFDHQKLLPRNDADLRVISCGGVPDKCEADECPVMPDAAETGRLVITEFQNNPSGDDSLREYVELYNPGPGRVDLAGWRVQDCAGNRVDLGGSVDARAFHVRARSVNMGENGGVRAQGDMGALFLPNGYGSILVFDADGSLVDQVRYEPGENGWPRRRPGEAAELPEPASDNRLGASWVAGEDDYGEGGQGSPGAPWRP